MNGTEEGHEVMQHLKLAAVGALVDANPDRIVLKRLVISGYPYKVHKRRATVRWMFFNPEVSAFATHMHACIHVYSATVELHAMLWLLVLVGLQAMLVPF